MHTRILVTLITPALFSLFSLNAQAYIGPGAGISAFGTLIALLGAVLLAIVGFVWYPLKRLRKKIATKKTAPEEQMPKEEPMATRTAEEDKAQ